MVAESLFYILIATGALQGNRGKFIIIIMEPHCQQIEDAQQNDKKILFNYTLDQLNFTLNFKYAPQKPQSLLVLDEKQLKRQKSKNEQERRLGKFQKIKMPAANQKQTKKQIKQIKNKHSQLRAEPKQINNSSMENKQEIYQDLLRALQNYQQINQSVEFQMKPYVPEEDKEPKKIVKKQKKSTNEYDELQRGLNQLLKQGYFESKPKNAQKTAQAPSKQPKRLQRIKQFEDSESLGPKNLVNFIKCESEQFQFDDDSPNQGSEVRNFSRDYLIPVSRKQKQGRDSYLQYQYKKIQKQAQKQDLNKQNKQRRLLNKEELLQKITYKSKQKDQRNISPKERHSQKGSMKFSWKQQQNLLPQREKEGKKRLQACTANIGKKLAKINEQIQKKIKKEQQEEEEDDKEQQEDDEEEEEDDDDSSQLQELQMQVKQEDISSSRPQSQGEQLKKRPQRNRKIGIYIQRQLQKQENRGCSVKTLLKKVLQHYTDQLNLIKDPQDRKKRHECLKRRIYESFSVLSAVGVLQRKQKYILPTKKMFKQYQEDLQLKQGLEALIRDQQANIKFKQQQYFDLVNQKRALQALYRRNTSKRIPQNRKILTNFKIITAYEPDLEMSLIINPENHKDTLTISTTNYLRPLHQIDYFMYLNKVLKTNQIGPQPDVHQSLKQKYYQSQRLFWQAQHNRNQRDRLLERMKRRARSVEKPRQNQQQGAQGQVWQTYSYSQFSQSIQQSQQQNSYSSSSLSPQPLKQKPIEKPKKQKKSAKVIDLDKQYSVVEKNKKKPGQIKEKQQQRQQRLESGEKAIEKGSVFQQQEQSEEDQLQTKKKQRKSKTKPKLPKKQKQKQKQEQRINQQKCRQLIRAKCLQIKKRKQQQNLRKIEAKQLKRKQKQQKQKEKALEKERKKDKSKSKSKDKEKEKEKEKDKGKSKSKDIGKQKQKQKQDE